MLRDLKHSHLSPVCVGLSANVTGATTGSLAIGLGDSASFTVANPSNQVTTLKNDIFSYSGNVIVGASIVDDRDTFLNAKMDSYLTDRTQVRSAIVEDTTGGGINGYNDLIVFGWKQLQTMDIASPLQIVKNTRVAPRMIPLYIQSGGTVAMGKGSASCTRTDTGEYVITFTRPFGITPVVAATCYNSGQKNICVSSKTAAGLVVKTSEPIAGTASNVGFFVLVLGWDSANEQYGMERPVQVPQRKPRLLLFRIQNSAGTPSLILGNKDGVLVDNATGDYTVTYTTPFKRTACSVALAVDAAVTVDALADTKTATRVILRNAAGSGVDGHVDIVVVGSDDEVDY